MLGAHDVLRQRLVPANASCDTTQLPHGRMHAAQEEWPRQAACSGVHSAVVREGVDLLIMDNRLQGCVREVLHLLHTERPFRDVDARWARHVDDGQVFVNLLGLSPFAMLQNGVAAFDTNVIVVTC